MTNDLGQILAVIDELPRRLPDGHGASRADYELVREHLKLCDQKVATLATLLPEEPHQAPHETRFFHRGRA